MLFARASMTEERQSAARARQQPIILFDGVCNLCHASVQFVIKRDSRKRFKFGTLQSERGQRLLAVHGLSGSSLSSVILLRDGKAYRKSAAALQVARDLDGLWPLMRGFMVVPRPIRDAVYDFIGNRRYQWFGKKASCWIPTPNLKDRFLD